MFCYRANDMSQKAHIVHKSGKTYNTQKEMGVYHRNNETMLNFPFIAKFITYPLRCSSER